MSKKTTVAAVTNLAKTADKNEYGSTTSLGARQSAIIVQLNSFKKLSATQLSKLNGDVSCNAALAALVARKLVSKKGFVYSLSASGKTASAELCKVVVPEGSKVGLVLSGVRSKR